MEYKQLILVVIALITATLSLTIVRGKKDSTNSIFSLFILAIGLWAFGLALFFMADEFNAFHFLRFFYIAALAIPTFFLHFSHIFPGEHRLSIKELCYIYAPAVMLSAIIIFVPDFIALDVAVMKSMKEVTINFPGYITYTLVFVILLLEGYRLLFKSYFAATDPIIRTQLKFIMLGTIVPYFLAMVFNLILPPWTYQFVWVGPLFAVLVIWVIMRGVYKHHLLNVKVITTELFTFGLWIFIFIRGVLSDSIQEKVLSAGLFLLTVTVGLLLIKSVRKEVEQRERIEKLAKELESTNKSLESANERLKELDHLKSEFVSMATHQIRGPLTAMKGYASMILQGDFGSVPDTLRSPVETIFESSNSLTGVVQDFLDISRIEQGRMKYDFSIFDLSKLAYDVAQELTPNIERKGLLLKFEIAPAITVKADIGKLKQVIENLIDNAQKYTPQGGRIVVRLEKRDTQAVLSVSDTGVGIKSETLPKLFQKFSRAEDASKANILGTGLGLYVAKELITAQGGTIRAESEGEGKGSTFSVELPLR